MPCVLATVALTTWSLFLDKHNNYFNVIGDSFEVGDGKAFWNLIKLKRTESIGIPPLQVRDKVFDSNEWKADILNKLLQSVFTPEDTSSLPQLPPSPYPQIDQLITNNPGLQKQLLQKLKKSCRPWSNITLCTENLCPTMCSDIARDFYSVLWKWRLTWGVEKALVSPVYKKDDKSFLNNYRPITLTCMEHVLCSHLSNHLEINNILTPHQHGFRKGFSTETRLIFVLGDWLSSLDKRIRSDVLLIDFSKPFDSAPHQRLLFKLNYYGITGNSLSWIKNFLLDCTQCVQVSGTRSSWISVTSGGPQCTVSGPLLFLIYINDSVHNLNSKIKLFADDAVLYFEVSNVQDVNLFQQGLDTLSCLAASWQMNFNLVKCIIMTITRCPLVSSWLQAL